MLVVPTNSINVPARMRTGMQTEKLDELADSIFRFGLQHPPVVRKLENGRLELVAGERRLRAISLLHGRRVPVSFMKSPLAPGMIVVNEYQELDPLEAKEIELEENIRREDLTWQDIAKATAELHALRKDANPSQTLSNTAAEISEKRGTIVGPTQISDRLILAEHLNRPCVQQAPSEKEAIRALRKELESDFLRALGRQTRITTQDKHTVELLSAETGMMRLPANCFDVVITDPPYGVEADKFHIESVAHKHLYTDEWEVVSKVLAVFFQESFRITKAQAHLYCFHDVQFFHLVKDMCAKVGWYVWPRPLIWVKDSGYTPRPQHGPRRIYETILYAIKGNRCVNLQQEDDVLIYPNERNRQHAAQKPVELYRDLLSRSVYPGCRVIDPFCGSGTVFPAAEALGCTAVGFDSDPAAVAMSISRITELKGATAGVKI